MPSAESKVNHDGGELHVGGLRANLGAMVEGEESGAFLLPVCALGDYGNTYVASAVGGVTWFLEYTEEVVAFVFPSSVYIDGVLGGGRLRFCSMLVIGAAGGGSWLGWRSGLLTGVMERMRWCRPCG